MKTTRPVSWLTPLLVLSLICSFALTATAQNYYPSEVGNTWGFLSADGAEQRTYTLEGPEDIDGEELILLRITNKTLGTDAVVLDKYFVTVDSEGGLILHQSAVDQGAFGIAESTFDPPVIFFPAALPLGHTWEIVTEMTLKLVGAATSTSTIEVVAIENVETPIGLFEDCVKLEINRVVVTALVTIRLTYYQWLAPDVGPVKYINDQDILYELQSYDLVEPPAAEEVPTEEAPVAEEVPAIEETPATEEVPTEEVLVEPVTEEPMPETTGPGFDVTLEPGLNMISIPLMPAEPYTAKALAEMLGATVIIQLDVATQNFIGYAAADDSDGFSIDGGKGYIVNTPTGGTMKFTGSAWDNQPEPTVEEPVVEEPMVEEPTVEEPAADVEEPMVEEPTVEEPAAEELPEEMVEELLEEVADDNTAADDTAAAPPLTTFRTAWAFIVTSNIHGIQTGTKYTLIAENLRTGTRAAENITTGARRATAVWADLNRKSVIEAGDTLEIVLYDDRGSVVSGPFQQTVTTTDIRKAFLHLDMTLGDVRPQETLLAQNYPNPFNPETWIPYQLRESAEVLIHIYDVSGRWVRTLDVGWQPVGSYMTVSSAAYWDGRNAVGERVASGIYFYTLQTSDFAATRRMVILK